MYKYLVLFIGGKYRSCKNRAEVEEAVEGVPSHHYHIIDAGGSYPVSLKAIPEDCPVCAFPLNYDDTMNSLSRKDNKTMICASCGTKEALESM